MRAFNAPRPADGFIPAYQIYKIEGKFRAELSKFNEVTRKLEKETIEYHGGYMVAFPKGHQIWYKSLEDLEKNGYGEVVEMIRAGHDSEMSSDAPRNIARPNIVVTDKIPEPEAIGDDGDD